MYFFFHVVVGKWICPVQVSQNLDCILTCHQIGKYIMQGLFDHDPVNIQLISVKSHGNRIDSEGTCLVETAASGGSTLFAPVCHIHDAECIEMQAVKLVESLCNHDTDGSRG